MIFDSTQALLTIQKLFGTFPQIIGKGDYAQASRRRFFIFIYSLLMKIQRLATLLTRQTPKAAKGSSSDPLLSSSPKIDSLIILDRRVDMITPLLTQLTYEGLVDELIGIKNCGFSRGESFSQILIINESTRGAAPVIVKSPSSWNQQRG